MTQQINLYDPSLLRKRDLLTAANVAVVSAVLFAIVGALGGWERAKLAALDAESRAIAPQTKLLQDQMVAIGKQLADAKPSPQLEAELATARARLGLREEILAALSKGFGGDTPSFAEYMRGFARQAQSGLWLTGFIIGEAGAALEIRGRMSDPALLPEYIRRLNGERVFQGRAFSALKVSPAKPAQAETAAAGTATPAPAPAPAKPPPPAARPGKAPYFDFVLIPVGGPLSEAVGAAAGTAAEARR